jgi:hypothetical protein
LREWLPSGHTLAPANVSWRKAADAQPFANFLLGKNTEAGSAAINMNHRHNAPLVLTRDRKGKTKCALGAR